MKYELKLHCQKLQHYGNKEGVFYSTKDAVPCILYLESRVGIFFLQLFFLKSHSNYELGDIFTKVRRSTNR